MDIAYNSSMESTMQAYIKATKAIEDALGAEQSKPVIEALNIGMSALEHKCFEQKPILQAEIKEELSKELASKADISKVEASIHNAESKLRIELTKLSTNIVMVKKDIVHLNSKFNWLIGIVIAAMTLFNPQFVQLIKLFFK